MRRALVVWMLCLLPANGFAHEIECPAAGADGQRVAVTAGQTSESAGTVRSNSQQISANWLCCNHGAGACTDFDTMARSGGPASRYIVSLEDVGTCTGIDITVGFREDATGVNHTVGTLSLSTDSLVIDGPRPRFVTATVNTMAGCGDNADVRVNTYHERANLLP